MTTKHGMFLLGLLVTVSRIDGQASQDALSLEECTRLAIAAHSTVAAARRQAEIAALESDRARSALLPQARLNGGFTYNSTLAGTAAAPSYVALNGPREYLGLLSATQELDLSGRLRAARARARADQLAATANLGISQRDLRRAVSVSYHRALLTRHLAAAARESLGESQSFEARTRLLFERGEAARADVVKAAAQTAFSEQAVAAADLDAELANHDLLSFWTKDVSASVTLRDDLDQPLPVPPAPVAGEPFLLRPEMALFAAQREGLLADARRARGERLPQANLMFQYGLDSLQPHWADRGSAFFVTVEVPIFDWFKAKNGARQFELQATQVESTRETQLRAFSKDYQDAVSRVRSLHAQIATTRSQVALSEENLRLGRVRYDGGEGSAFDVVGAQSQLVQARNNHYTAMAAYLESLTDLDIASGK